MAIIKKTKCKCGQEYIDFGNQLGCCPQCSEDKEIATVQQAILANFTYTEDSVALKHVSKLLAMAKIDNTNAKAEGQKPEAEAEAEAEAEGQRPEATQKISFVRKLVNLIYKD